MKQFDWDLASTALYLFPYLKTKIVPVCGLFSTKYAMNTVHTAPGIWNALNPFSRQMYWLKRYYHIRTSPYSEVLTINGTYLICAGFESIRIRFAYSKSSVFEAYQCESKAKTERFCFVFIQIRSCVKGHYHSIARLLTTSFDRLRHDSIAYAIIRLLTTWLYCSRHHSISHVKWNLRGNFSKVSSITIFILIRGGSVKARPTSIGSLFFFLHLNTEQFELG